MICFFFRRWNVVLATEFLISCNDRSSFLFWQQTPGFKQSFSVREEVEGETANDLGVSYPGQDWPVRNLQKTDAFPETLKSSLDFTYVLESITCILRTKPIFRLYSCRQFAESQLKIVELNRKKMDITRSSETYWKKKNLVYNFYALARLKGSFYCRFLDIRLWWTL